MRLNLKDIVLKSKLEMAKTLYANGEFILYLTCHRLKLACINDRINVYRQS